MSRKGYVGLTGGILLMVAVSAGSDASAKKLTAVAAATAIPQSVQAEHTAIHSALEDAQRAPGRVGAAARRLARVLHPHFVREEEIALPPLGLLAPLAAGSPPPNAAAILPLTDALERELPRMLEEHVQIRAAVEELRAAATAHGAAAQVRLAADLAQHARFEEEVLYPAAVLVGRVVRGGSPAKQAKSSLFAAMAFGN